MEPATPPTRSTPAAARIAQVVLALCLGGGLGGCDDGAGPKTLGGQSGGEVVDDPISFVPLVPCPCWIADRAVAVTATLEHVDSCRVSAVVDAVLAGAERAPVQAGETLSGSPITCGYTQPSEPGEQVLLLYAPADDAPDGGPVEEALTEDDAGAPVTTTPTVPQAQIFHTKLDAPIHIDFATEPLPDDRNEALKVLLNVSACRQWVIDHAPPPAPPPEPDAVHPEEPSQRAEPDDPVVRAADAPADDEEAPPACTP